MKRVCTYIRITKPENAPSVIDKHEEQVNKLIVEQCGWVLERQFREIAFHKINNRRYVLRQIKNEVEQKQIDILLVPSVSMISRDMAEALAFVRALSQNGCQVLFGDSNNSDCRIDNNVVEVFLQQIQKGKPL